MAERTKTILDMTIDAWKEGKDPKSWKPDPKSTKAFKDKVAKSRNAVTEAEALLESTKKARDEADAEAIKFFGPHEIKLEDGTVLAPTCRGERLFYHESNSTPL